MAPVVDKWQQISADIAELVSQSEVLRLVRDMGYLTVIREDAQKKYLLNLFHTMNAKQEREEGWKVGRHLPGWIGPVCAESRSWTADRPNSNTGRSRADR